MYGIEERPQSFKELIGNTAANNLLKKIVVKNVVANGYIFSGEYGTGKTTTSAIFAKALLCSDPQDGDACNACKSCTQFNAAAHPGYQEVDSGNSGGKDTATEIVRTTMLKGLGGRRIVCFEEAHRLTTSAMDALLRVLETPELSKDVVFIFCTTELDKLPDTIKSRCLKVNIQLPTTNEVKAKLTQICVKHSIEYDDDALQLLAVFSKGHFRNAENELWGISISGPVSYASAKDYIGAHTDEVAEMLVNIRTNIKRSLEISNDLITKIGGKSLGILAFQLMVDTQRAILLHESESGKYGEAISVLARGLGTSLLPMIEYLRGKNDLSDAINIDADIIILHHKFMRGDFKVVDVTLPPPKESVNSKVPIKDPSEDTKNLTAWEVCERQRVAKAAARKQVDGPDAEKKSFVGYSVKTDVAVVRRS